jgi:hypothetical protein
MYLQKVPNKQKKLLLFIGILKLTDEKNRIRIRKSVVRIHGSGSVQKWHEYGFQASRRPINICAKIDELTKVRNILWYRVLLLFRV